MMLDTIQRADQALYASLTDRKHAANIAQIARLVSRSGDGHLYLALAILMLWLDKTQGAEFFITALIAFAFELPLYLLLKNLFKRNRPCEVLRSLPAFVKPSDKFSLPSGHTAAGFVMASVASHFYDEFSVYFFCWATLIGASRVLLRVHFPTDIICGSVLGGVTAWIGLMLWV